MMRSLGCGGLLVKPGLRRLQGREKMKDSVAFVGLLPRKVP